MPRPSRLPQLLAGLDALGGVATADDLRAVATRSALRTAVAAGLVHRLGGGWYAATGHEDPRLGPTAPSRSWARWEDGPGDEEQRALRARHALALGAGAALSHRCAAAHHGWPVLTAPTALELAVPPGRHTRRRLQGHPCVMQARHLTDEEREQGVTSALRTVLDAARDLPPVEAVAVADSALRSGAVGALELREGADRYRGRHAARVRAVAAFADAGAANPFESVLRHRLRDTGLTVVTQHVIADRGFSARVDLADVGLRVVCEADSYAFHGSPERQAADQIRYAELVTRGWLVLPFGWGAVMDRPAWVARVASDVVALCRTEGWFGSSRHDDGLDRVTRLDRAGRGHSPGHKRDRERSQGVSGRRIGRPDRTLP